MIDWDKWQEIFDSINRHRLRTILTAFGVAWGIFMLVILLGAGQGLQNGVRYDFEGDALNSLWINTGTTSKAFDGLKEGREIELNNEDYDFLNEEFKEIEHLSGNFFMRWSTLVTYGDKTQTYSIRGTHHKGDIIENLHITEGRYINEYDVKNQRKVAVIGRNVKEELFGNESPLGAQVNVAGVVFQVIGTFYDQEEGRTMDRLYVPISTAQSISSAFGEIHQLTVVFGEDKSVDEINAMETELLHTFSERKLFDPTDRQAMRIWNMADAFQEFMGLMNAIGGIMWIVGIFSIIAGVIGVSNIMLIIVKDRTKEIGIRKAMGATPRSIIGMIFQESIFITALAGYVGLGVGIAVLSVLGQAESDFFRQPEINLSVAIGATIILVLAGALAGLLPAIQAARINPVEAIKNE